MGMTRPKLCLSLRSMILLVACCGALFLAWRTISDSDPIERAVRDLKFQCADDRRAAAERLKEGEPERMAVIVPALTDALSDEDPRVRLEAIKSLDYLIRRWAVTFQTTRAPATASVVSVRPIIPVLIGAVRDKDARVRAAAIDALGLLTPAEADRALPVLIAILGGPTGEDRAHAAAALGKAGVGSAEVKRALVVAIRDPKPEVRTEAARALTGFFDDPAIAIQVLEILEHDAADDELRERAFKAFAQMAHSGDVARRAVPLVLRSLRSRNNLRRLSALSTLEQADLRAPESQVAVPVLIEMLQKGSAPLRPGAAAALGHLGRAAATALPALEAAMKDPNQGLRDAAAKAQERIRKDLSKQDLSRSQTAETMMKVDLAP
ncbi:MAG TPA: HEAT repeat domain-containing protein [Isosphaeraceae bacterium]|nr:HEAT repeat domain-containing protein [Isosphaeraceae bacterium]